MLGGGTFPYLPADTLMTNEKEFPQYQLVSSLIIIDFMTDAKFIVVYKY